LLPDEAHGERLKVLKTTVDPKEEAEGEDWR
jgi:hypothetical protein